MKPTYTVTIEFENPAISTSLRITFWRDKEPMHYRGYSRMGSDPLYMHEAIGEWLTEGNVPRF